MSRALLSWGALVAVYALALASWHPWDLAAGGLLAAGVLGGLRHFLRAGQHTAAPGRHAPGVATPVARLAACPALVLALLSEIARGTWAVALVALRLRPLARPGIVVVPIGERSPAGVVVGALLSSLAPGSFLLEIDWERGVMLFHVLDARDPEAFRASQQRFYQRYQRRVLP